MHSDLFGFVDDKRFHFWQDVNRESIVDLVASRSYVATLDDDAREAKLAQVLALYDDYGRGMDGMQLPYDCECFRAQVVDRPDARRGRLGRRRRRGGRPPDAPARPQTTRTVTAAGSPTAPTPTCC